MDMELLKMARAMNDQNFIWRTSASMTSEAKYRFQNLVQQTTSEASLMDWALENPMRVHSDMLNFLVTDTDIAAAITVINDAVSTDDVTDLMIRQKVSGYWTVVANRVFGFPA